MSSQKYKFDFVSTYCKENPDFFKNLFKILAHVVSFPEFHDYLNFALFLQISTVFYVQQETCHLSPKESKSANASEQ